MTPKEKAKKLANNFAVFTPRDRYAGTLAAMECVDEIIKANPTELVDGCLFTINPVNEMVKIDTTKYWEQVKEELKNI